MNARSYPVHGLIEPISLDLIAGIGGIRGIGVIRLLFEREHTETELAEALSLPEQTVRGILQRFYDEKLVSFRKEREPNGWFVYHWTLSPDGLREAVRRRKRHTVKLLRRRVEFEQSNHFFICEERCMRLTFDEGFEHDFICPECGGVLRQHDNEFRRHELADYIERLEIH